METLQRFSDTNSVEGRAQIVLQHPELLNSTTDSMLRDFEAFLRAEGLTDPADALGRTREFFSHCRAIGVDNASEQDRQALEDLRVHGLATAGLEYSERYAQSGGRHDLEEAIRLLHQAHAECPKSSPNRTRLADNLGRLYLFRHEWTGEDCDLECAVALGEEAISSPEKGPERFEPRINFSAALLERFQRRSQRTDLDRAIDLLVPAERELPRRTESWAAAAYNLGAALRQRALTNGGLADIDDAIKLLSEVADASRRGTPASILYYGGLANAYHQRLSETARLEDLEAAISAYRIALSGAPPSLIERARLLNNLGVALATKYEISDDKSALDDALRLFSASLQILPPPSPRGHGALVNLGTYTAERYRHSRREEDYSQSLHWLNLAKDQLVGQPEFVGVLSNLASTHAIRFWETNEKPDLDAAIALWEHAVTLPSSPGPHFDRVRNLGSALSDLYRLTRCPADRDRARQLFDSTIGKPTADSRSELLAANNWGHSAFERATALEAGGNTQDNWQEAARAFDLARGAAERLHRSQLVRRHQADWIAKTQQTPARHAYALFMSGQSERAVEALEAGRNLLIRESLERNRADLGRLGEVGQSELLKRYRDAITAMALAEMPTQAPSNISAVTTHNYEMGKSAQRLQESIDSIRAVPGFENFLRPTSFSEILAAANEPLAYLLATTGGSLALIVYDNQVRAVPLPCTLPAIESWMVSYEPGAGPVGYLPVTAAGQPGIRGTLNRLLPQIGRQLIEPLASVLRDLLDPLGTAKPIVRLIPTGWLALLPLHAASYSTWENTSTTLLDEFTVIYTPSASVLRWPVQSPRSFASSLMAVGDPSPLPPGLQSLPYARFEAAAVCSVSPGSLPPLLGEEASPSAVLTKWAEARTVHLACHGIFDVTAPLRSALILAGGKLTLEDIFAELVTGRVPQEVVLSACQTALADFRRLPEEAIGFPGGLLQAGVATVIAALWWVNDWSTSLLMAKYAIERQSHAPASALRQAQIWLRDATATELVNFTLNLQRNMSPTEAGIIKSPLNALVVALRETPPFCDPYYWAGFSCWGIG